MLPLMKGGRARPPGASVRSPLRYFGGKASIADWIIEHFPEHESYIDPFGGGGAVLLRKPRAELETYNDLSRDVVAFFKVLRDRLEDLARAIELTPYSRAECDAAYDALVESDAELDDLERARLFYVVSWQTIHGAPPPDTRIGWRYRLKPTGSTDVKSWNVTGHIKHLAERLKGVQIECRDAVEVIGRYSYERSLVYADPPYLSDTRGRRWSKRAYVHELVDEEGHQRLIDALLAAPGYVVLSGYRSTLYDDALAGWHRVERESRKQSGAWGVECLWLNPAAAGAMKQPRLIA